MLKKRGVLREDEMRLPWLVLLLFPFFRCRILSPDLNLIRFLNWENSRHRRVFRFGSVLLPVPDFRFSDSVATMRHSFHIPTALRFAVSTFPLARLCAPADTNHRHSTCACPRETVCFSMPHSMRNRRTPR